MAKVEDDFELQLEAQNLEIMRSARDEFELESGVKVFGSTVGIVVASLLVTMMVLGSVFFVRSFWLFTHPNFEFSIPKLPSFSLLSTGPFGDAPKSDPSAPRSSQSNVPPKSTRYTEAAIQAYLDRLGSRGDSLADAMTNKEKFDLGDQVCQSLAQGFTQADIASGFESSLKKHFPNVVGVPTLVADVLDAATKNLCPTPGLIAP